MTVFGVSATSPGGTPTEWAATYQQQRAAIPARPTGTSVATEARGARGCFIYTPQGTTPDTRRLATVPLTDVAVFSPKTCNAATAKTLVDGCPKRTGNVYMALWQEWDDDMAPAAYKAMAEDFLAGWDDKARPRFVKCGYGTWWGLSQGRDMAGGIPKQATHICWSVYGALKSDPRAKLAAVAKFMTAHPTLTWGVAACGAAVPASPSSADLTAQALWVSRMVEGCAAHNVPYALWFDRDYPQGKGDFSLAANPAAQAAWYGR